MPTRSPLTRYKHRYSYAIIRYLHLSQLDTLRTAAMSFGSKSSRNATSASSSSPLPLQLPFTCSRLQPSSIHTRPLSTYRLSPANVLLPYRSRIAFLLLPATDPGTFLPSDPTPARFPMQHIMTRRDITLAGKQTPLDVWVRCVTTSSRRQLKSVMPLAEFVVA